MIYTFIGDCHGKIVELIKLLDATSKSDRVLQLGDMGLGFPNVRLPKLHPDFGFIRGNHDDPTACAAHPNYAGEYGMWRGIFVIGGAYSIDWRWRVPGASWWVHEELDDHQWELLRPLYAAARPKVVAAHECPSDIGAQLLADGGFRPEKWSCTSSRTARNMDELLAIHRPEHWFFGHYHRDWQVIDHDTTFTCLDELSTASLKL